ncbi:putative baseplate assembly protein [Actinomycetospora chibensis]|uniref:Baseplate assembly protein n=1 Tax=Actinomycetospora chibensis TaxID=663606 RepID=A0ABV9RNW0_9PSEU|nr:putative baseplate assembly protein [Actinomycetospora chibensis]MDD7926957.1 putative baseplate assembly protein [Actinomycetospora chibensis]
MSELICRDNRRRAALRASGHNGLDYLEVGDDQRTLTAFFLVKGPARITAADVAVVGGRRVRDICVVDVRMGRAEDPDRDDCMVVTLDKAGDFSTYELRVNSADLDPRYSVLPFSFKVNCPAELDCVAEPPPPPPPTYGPEISYLAKDYASFRQMLLDRLAVVMPQWHEDHVPDLGITLVELLAFVGDQLSYHQDAVATEAYLGTARQRISVRRHARLVDYRMHEGANARAFVCLATDTDVTLPEDAFFATRGDREVFEPMWPRARTIRAAHSRICFYTWGDGECVLPKGATSATLLDEHDALHLRAGQVLIFEEVLSPKTGAAADRDPRRRHAVMLIAVDRARDPLNGALLVEICWAPEDALPFPLYLSAVGPPPACAELTDVSVARGNVVLVDHGRLVSDEDLGAVPQLSAVMPCAEAACGRSATFTPGRFAPVLAQSPVTFRAPPPATTSAAALMAPPDPRAALPALDLTSLPSAPGQVDDLFDRADLLDVVAVAARLQDPATPADHALFAMVSAAARDEAEALRSELRALLQRWAPVYDLLTSAPTDRHVVVEVDNNGRAHLRLGDGRLGRRPEAHERFSADYRVGGGSAGNVGADTIVCVGRRTPGSDMAVLTARNPLPAWGGTDREPVQSVKLRAPSAFRREMVRAVVAEDYARLAERDPHVQRAAGVRRFTGSRIEVHVAIDAYGGVADPALVARVAAALEPFRRIGHEIVVLPATTVPLDVAITVCVRPDRIAGHVRAAVLDVLAAFFDPDRLTFGDDVRVSRLVVAVLAVAGVDNAQVTCLRRLEGGDNVVDDGVLRIGPLEVARLDRDPDAPENGRLTVKVEGGR